METLIFKVGQYYRTTTKVDEIIVQIIKVTPKHIWLENIEVLKCDETDPYEPNAVTNLRTPVSPLAPKFELLENYNGPV